MKKKLYARARKILRTLKGDARKSATDHIDAPILRAVRTRIPVGDAVLVVPNSEPFHSSDTVEEVRLGEVTINGHFGRIRQRGVWLMEFSWHGGQTFLPPSYRTEPQRERQAERQETIRGRVTSTVVYQGRVYGHALLDELPLLLYLLNTGRFREFDGILMGSLAGRLLKRCTHPDIDALLARTIIAQSNVVYRADDFTAIQRTGCCRNPSRQELDLVRQFAKPNPAVKQEIMPTCIFLKRTSNTRSIENEAEVDLIIAKHGLSPINASKISNPWQMFAQAKLVVGVAGSDLSDCCFMAPGASLLEIHPTDHVQPYNWNVAQTLGLRYSGLRARSKVERNTPIRPGDSAIHINTRTLDDQLSKILEELA